jgi:hypothetical protein
MAIDTAPLERIGIHVSPQELERRLEAALKEVLPERVAPRPAGELSTEEAGALTRGGLDLSPQGARKVDGGVTNSLVQAATEYAALVASSYTVAEAARRLGVDGSRIRQRLAARTLYGIKQAGIWRIPAFQFAGHTPVPHLEQVLPCLDPGLSPITVVRWFSTPHPDLVQGAEDKPLSPLDWLSAGHRPGPVVELAQDLGAGL